MKHLRAAYEAARSYEIERCKVDDLDKINLELYPTIILLNVSEIKNEKTIQKVQEYIQHGGSLCYFLGDKARPAFYNDTLFKKFDGLFPVLIENRPFDPLNPDGRETEEQARGEGQGSAPLRRTTETALPRSQARCRQDAGGLSLGAALL